MTQATPEDASIIRQAETKRVLVLSTAHIPEADAKLLNAGAKPNHYFLTGEYGWQFSTTFDAGNRGWSPEVTDTIGGVGFTDVIPNILRRFAGQFERVEFDRDAETLEGLDTFEW